MQILTPKEMTVTKMITVFFRDVTRVVWYVFTKVSEEPAASVFNCTQSSTGSSFLMGKVG
jgi:hypothetical protein